MLPKNRVHPWNPNPPKIRHMPRPKLFHLGLQTPFQENVGFWWAKVNEYHQPLPCPNLRSLVSSFNPSTLWVQHAILDSNWKMKVLNLAKIVISGLEVKINNSIAWNRYRPRNQAPQGRANLTTKVILSLIRLPNSIFGTRNFRTWVASTWAIAFAPILNEGIWWAGQGRAGSSPTIHKFFIL